MVTPSGAFSDRLTAIALKGMLQKALFAQISLQPLPIAASSDAFPLADCSATSPIGYPSAIALKLAAALATPATALAPTVAAQLTPTTPIGQSVCFAWSVQVRDRGWLHIDVPDTVIGWWLQQLTQTLADWLASSSPHPLALAETITPPHPEWGGSEPPARSLSLARCQDLQLSPAMFLRFSYARCHAWLTAFNPTVSSLSHPWQWHPQSPAACHTLLQTLVTAMDELAAHPNDATTYWRQGYRLAAAVYDCQRSLTLTAGLTEAIAIQASIWSVYQAVQHILASLLLALGQAPPLPSL